MILTILLLVVRNSGEIIFQKLLNLLISQLMKLKNTVKLSGTKLVN